MDSPVGRQRLLHWLLGALVLLALLGLWLLVELLVDGIRILL